MKDRIIKWMKADTDLYNPNAPEGNPEGQSVTTKVTNIIFGVPEEEHWQKELAPYISVSNGDQFLVSSQFFGSVVNDALTSSYEKYQFDIVLVVQGADAETTERLIDSLHNKVLQRLRSNVQLKDTVTDTTDPNFGTLIQGTELCSTTRIVKTDSLQAPVLNRRLFAYRVILEVEVDP